MAITIGGGITIGSGISLGGGTISSSPTPTYSVTPGAGSINEGSGLTFTVSGTNITDGTYYWAINNVTTSTADFGTNSGLFTITGNSGSFTVTPTADNLTEGAETFTVSVLTGSTSGTVVATSTSVTVNDTSTTPAPSYTATPTANNVNEGSSLTINVTGSNITDGTYYWTINNGTTSTADFGTNSGSFSITSNSGSFSVTPTADNLTEGAETFTVQIRTGSTSGTVVATTSTITVNDTSTTPGRGGNRVVFFAYSSAPASFGAYSVDPYTSIVSSTTVPQSTITAGYCASSGNVLMVADGYGQGGTTNTAGNALTTSDGITWNQVTRLPQFSPNPANIRWSGLAYGKGTWVAVAGGPNAQSTQVAYSTNNGSTWTSINPLPSNYYVGGGFGNNIFVALAPFGSNGYSSTDGITWTQGPVRPTNFSTTPVYVPSLNKWYAIDHTPSTSGNLMVATSTNNMSSWTSNTYSTPGILYYDNVLWAYGNGVFVVLNTLQTFSYTSTDGVNWTQHSGVFSGQFYWNKLVWTGTEFIAASTTINPYVSSYWYSPDGATWTQITSVPGDPTGTQGLLLDGLLTS